MPLVFKATGYLILPRKFSFIQGSGNAETKRIPLNNKGSGPGTERKPLIWEGFKNDPRADKGI